MTTANSIGGKAMGCYRTFARPGFSFFFPPLFTPPTSLNKNLATGGGLARPQSRFFALLLLCLCFLLLAPTAGAEPVYSVEQLGVLAEGSHRVVRAMNGNGVAVGSAGERGFQLSHGIQVIQGVPGTDYSTAFGINNLGEVVGSANVDSGIRAFRYSPGTGAVDLGMLPGDSSSEALAINDKGEIAGYSSGIAGAFAVVWSRAGTIRALPQLDGSKSSKGFAINGRGDVAGISVTRSGRRAVLWTNESVQKLETLPGHSVSEALAINERGEIVGSSGDPRVARHAVLWTRDGAIRDLGVTSGSTLSRALGINNRGEIVGTLHIDHGDRAFVWTQSGGMRDLNNLVQSLAGFVLTHAVAINSDGTILALGLDEDKHAADNGGHEHEIDEVPIHVFLLIPQR